VPTRATRFTPTDDADDPARSRAAQE